MPDDRERPKEVDVSKRFKDRPIQRGRQVDLCTRADAASTDPVVTVVQTPAVWSRPSCLVAGTPVWTELGYVAVEEVRVGDRVVACDCESGRIMLKPVLRTIVNRQTSLFGLHAASETLEVTGGHAFWVSGQGWVNARQLQPKMRLHTLKGTVDLASIEPRGRQDTYNLVVADFHTCFVGKEKILTHDNTTRKPTNCVVPGLAAHCVYHSVSCPSPQPFLPSHRHCLLELCLTQRPGDRWIASRQPRGPILLHNVDECLR